MRLFLNGEVVLCTKIYAKYCCWSTLNLLVAVYKQNNLLKQKNYYYMIDFPPRSKV